MYIKMFGERVLGQANSMRSTCTMLSPPLIFEPFEQKNSIGFPIHQPQKQCGI